MFRVFRFPYLTEQLRLLSRGERDRIAAVEQHLLRDPRGQMLGLPFFREKRLNGKRLLFLVYEEERVVLLVMVTDKRYQQRDIDQLKARLPRYYAFVRERLRG